MNVFPLLENSVENEERKRERERDEVEECKHCMLIKWKMHSGFGMMMTIE